LGETLMATLAQRDSELRDLVKLLLGREGNKGREERSGDDA